SLTVQAVGENTPTANASVESISFVVASGAFAEADVTGEASTDASIGSGAHVTTSGGVTVHAQLHGSNNTATANADGLSGAAFAAISIMGSKSEVDAAVTAHLDGPVLGSGSLTVEPDGGDVANATTDVTSLSIGF